MKDDQWLCAMVNNSDQCRTYIFIDIHTCQNISSPPYFTIYVIRRMYGMYVCLYVCIYINSNLDDLSRRLVAIMQKDEKREAALLSPRATSPKAKALAAAAASETKDGAADEHDEKKETNIINSNGDEKPLSEQAEEVFEDCGYTFCNII